jgi:hypothetical protein
MTFNAEFAKLVLQHLTCNQEIRMFNIHSQLHAHTFQRDISPTTWQAIARLNHDTDVDLRLYKVHTKNRLSALIAGLAKSFHRLQSSLWLRIKAMPALPIKQNPRLERQSTVDR